MWNILALLAGIPLLAGWVFWARHAAWLEETWREWF